MLRTEERRKVRQDIGQRQGSRRRRWFEDRSSKFKSPVRDPEEYRVDRVFPPQNNQVRISTLIS